MYTPTKNIYTPTSPTSSSKMDGEHSLASPYMRWIVCTSRPCIV